MNKPGDKYQPSSGTEGEIFMEQWCYKCTKGADEASSGCTILLATMSFDKDHELYPPQWTYDNKGNPVCTAFQREGVPIPTDHKRNDDVVNFWLQPQSFDGTPESLTKKVRSY